MVENIPGWLGAGLLGAVVAALGFAGKAVFQQFVDLTDERRRRRAALVQMHSLLRAARVAFLIQNKNARALCDIVQPRLGLSDDKGYEHVLSSAYPHMTESERDLHTYIRSITVHTMKPLNDAMLAWINSDAYFKAKRGSGIFGELAPQLALLEAHLLLWRAKYEVWIPGRADHALVYMEDENEHGLGFPRAIDGIIHRLFPGSAVELGASG